MDFSYLKHLSGGHDKKQTLHLLMQAYGDDVWNFAYFLTKQRVLADDIRQDVFVKAYRKLDTFRGESSPKSWLLTITRRVAHDYRRSAFFRRVTLMEYMSEQRTDLSAENEYLRSQHLRDTWSCVLALPVKLREVLVLHAHYQYTIPEIGRLLNISESAVKVRLHRARKKVNALMAADEEGKLNEQY